MKKKKGPRQVVSIEIQESVDCEIVEVTFNDGDKMKIGTVREWGDNKWQSRTEGKLPHNVVMHHLSRMLAVTSLVSRRF